MCIWIVLLRGINVSGQKKIIMAELRALLGSNNGFAEVKSYIQSGNLIFEADEALAKEEIEGRVSYLIQSNYGYDVGVFAFQPDWLKHIAFANPFLEDAKIEQQQLYLAILDQVPSQANLNRLAEVNSGDDEYVLQGSVIYLRYSQGAGKTKLTNTLIESKLKVRATSRNWNTVMKLLELSQ